MPRPGFDGRSPPATLRTTALVVQSEREGEEPARAPSFTVETTTPDSRMWTRRSSSFRVTVPSLQQPPYSAGWAQVDVAPGATARPPTLISSAPKSGVIWGPRGSPGRSDDPSANLNHAMLYYPAVSRGLGTPIAGGRFPLVGFAHGHRLPWAGDDLLSGRRADVDADPSDFTQDYRQWAGLLRYLASWGFIVVSPDLHWIITGSERGDADVAGRADALGAAIDSIRLDEVLAGSLQASWAALGHSQGGAAVWNFARSRPDAPASAVGLIGARVHEVFGGQGGFEAPDRGAWAYPVFFMVGDVDLFRDQILEVFADLGGTKVLVDIEGADHWGFTDSIAVLPPPTVLTDGSLAEQQSAQRIVGMHFITAFFRKHLGGEGDISEALDASSLRSRVPNLRGVRIRL